MPAPITKELLTLSITWRSMKAEAQSVVGMGTLGMAGLWAATPNETDRMVAEKAPRNDQGPNRRP